MADLTNAARAKPGELTFASTGPASPSHVALEILKRAAKLEMIYVPFPGNAPTINAVLGGHVTAGIANYADVVGHLKAGTLRALVTPSPTRIEAMPDLPTAAESGHRELRTRFGPACSPAKTSKTWYHCFQLVRCRDTGSRGPKLVVRDFTRSKPAARFAGDSRAISRHGHASARPISKPSRA
jgi:tripartite-type tricarboxylate transporter receptor subunit TctC